MPDAQAILTIDLDALVANWRLLAARAAPAACGAAVKADAYGIGIEAAVPALARAGCRTFFTAHVAEGALARSSLRSAGFGDDACRIFVLSGFLPRAAPAEAYRHASVSPTLCSRAQMDAWIAAHAGAAPPSALHVDTGLNRTGMEVAEALALDLAILAAAHVTLVMSHLVAADAPDNPLNAAQAERFAALLRGPLGTLPASLANSAGLFLPEVPRHDLARPGFALYGGNAIPVRPNPMRAVVGLTAPILQVRSIAAGATVGYGAAWTARRPTRLATIGIGYADGLPRNALTVGETAGPVAMVGGVRCPLVGRVSMDLSIVDVTDAPEQAGRAGESVELLGTTITVDDLAAGTQTTGYEILTRIGRRYTRVYRGGG